MCVVPRAGWSRSVVALTVSGPRVVGGTALAFLTSVLRRVPLMETTKKDSQTPWNCRWGRFDYRFTGVPNLEKSEWLCVRPLSARRTVTEEDCAPCEFWERGIDESES